MTAAPQPDFFDRLSTAFQARTHLVDAGHETAFRLMNGFLEGETDLVLEIFAKTLVVYSHAEDQAQTGEKIQAVVEMALTHFPWLGSVVVKKRGAPDVQQRQGILYLGNRVDARIQEHGIHYAIDLLMNQDASFYLDTRLLRSWAKGRLAGKTVLNTFAYTGSLGVAALAGGARRVVQLDHSRKFLNLAKRSYLLNGFSISRPDFIVGDFWVEINRLKRQGALFDCVFVDPPFFSTTSKGKVDLAHDAQRVINKVRPLIKDGGQLVAINNALFLSGADYLTSLERLCADGYLSIEEFIPVPEDTIGFTHTRLKTLPVDPSPFNHSTKIAILRVRRKS